MNSFCPSYRRYRFPTEIISHCVWLYFRFSLSLRDVEEMMNERGVKVTYETVREWCLKFGGAYAKRVRAYSPRSCDLGTQRLEPISSHHSCFRRKIGTEN